MKKIISSILILTLTIFCIGGCGKASNGDVKDGTGDGNSTVEPSATGDKGLIAVSLPTLDNPLMLGIGDTFKNTFGADFDVEVASADGDSNTQVSQIENYITMKAKMIAVMPVESTSLIPVLERAREAGIKVFVNGTKLDDSAYDCMATVNQYLVGEYCALMAKEWVDENFPDAKEGSIDAAVFTCSLNEDAVARTKGLLSIAEPYLKNVNGEYIDENNNVVDESKKVDNPTYCPAINLAVKTDAEMFQAGQTTMQNILTTNPNIKVVLAYTSDGGCGANQVFMDKGLSDEDLKNIGIFGCGVIGSEEEYILDSANGKGVFRGAVAFGGKDLAGEMAKLAKKVLYDEGYEKDNWDPIAKVIVKDGNVARIEVANEGVVKAD